MRYRLSSDLSKSCDANMPPSVPMNPPFPEWPWAHPKPINQKDKAPAQASNKFLMRIFFEFLLRTRPFSSRAKPSYISKINAVDTMTRSSLMALWFVFIVSSGLSEVIDEVYENRVVILVCLHEWMLEFNNKIERRNNWSNLFCGHPKA